ncbi:MAG: hypothetical protein AAFV29_16130, partial [Myxococcota bacterium]
VPEVARARVGVQRPIETNGETETVTVPSAANEAPWEERIAALEQTMADLPLMGPENLEPLHERLARLEAMLGQALTSPSAPPPQPEQRPLLFDAAELGTPDNLKRIGGVGPVLEKLLNRLGVWYFWQIAGWQEKEVNYIDKHLAASKGRIRRDDWVSQAAELAKKSDRKPPTEQTTTASS